MPALHFPSGKERRVSSVEGGTIRAGVVGLGYYGSFHAEKYATLPGCELVAVADRHIEKADKVAMEHDAKGFTDYRELIGMVDAVSVVTPAGGHFSVARDFLEAGVHVLVEKPITETVAEARELIRLAREKGCRLQVGHLERFNPAFGALPEQLRAPTYIETHRLTRFQSRGHDVSVVLDLMIHDIDLVHALVRSPVTAVQAKGVSVYSDAMDLVNAVIHFESGAVANLTASRASMEPQRTVHLFQHHAYTCLDMHHKSIVTQLQQEDGQLDVDELDLENEDILRTEVAAFLEAVRNGSEPVVTGEDGLRALDTAIRISEVMEQSSDPGEPLPIRESEGSRGRYVTQDHHPDTREPVFSRTSLVDPNRKSNKKENG
jgi:predicted dehydrogenase